MSGWPAFVVDFMYEHEAGAWPEPAWPSAMVATAETTGDRNFTHDLAVAE